MLMALELGQPCFSLLLEAENAQQQPRQLEAALTGAL